MKKLKFMEKDWSRCIHLSFEINDKGEDLLWCTRLNKFCPANNEICHPTIPIFLTDESDTPEASNDTETF